jgi:hypothetical protein
MREVIDSQVFLYDLIMLILLAAMFALEVLYFIFSKRAETQVNKFEDVKSDDQNI